MADKNKGVPHPKKDKNMGKAGSMKDINILDNVILQCVWYMEIAKDALMYLQKENRLQKQAEFRFMVEINLIANQLKNWFGVSPAWVMSTAEELRSDAEAWKNEVVKFANLIAPPKPLIVTENLEQELLNIKGRNALLGNTQPNSGPTVPPGKGRIII